MFFPKIVGAKKAAGAIRNCPKGFHVEVWSYMDGKTVQIYTTDYLTQNSWTINHAEGHRCISNELANLEYADWYLGEKMSLTERIKMAAATVWTDKMEMGA